METAKRKQQFLHENQTAMRSYYRDRQEGCFLLKAFPNWRKTDGRVLITRYLETEYGLVRQDIYLSRAIVKPPTHLVVDHIDRNTLNNKRSNLRLATIRQNATNRTKSKNKTSKYYGVSLAKGKGTEHKPWRVFLRDLNGERVCKCFATEMEAAIAHDKHAKKIWGEFAPLNFPDER